MQSQDIKLSLNPITGICRTTPTSLKSFYGQMFCNECFKTHVISHFRSDSPRIPMCNWWMHGGTGCIPQEPAQEKKEECKIISIQIVSVEQERSLCSSADSIGWRWWWKYPTHSFFSSIWLLCSWGPVLTTALTCSVKAFWSSHYQVSPYKLDKPF